MDILMRTLFFTLNLRAKFHKLRTTPSGIKVCGGEEEKKKIPNIVATSFHAPRSDQKQFLYDLI
jgi:hypothetical protein